jgi:hypothetical protein
MKEGRTVGRHEKGKERSKEQKERTKERMNDGTNERRTGWDGKKGGG